MLYLFFESPPVGSKISIRLYVVIRVQQYETTWTVWW